MSDDAERLWFAETIAQRLLEPTVLDEVYRSGLFIHWDRGAGQKAILLNELIPALEKRGAIVIYVDMQGALADDPINSIWAAVRQKFALLEIDFAGLPAWERETFVGAFGALVSRTQRNVVLVIDSIEFAMESRLGESLMQGLKAARDRINLKPSTRGYFLLVGMGDDPEAIKALAINPQWPFFGAATILCED